MNTSVQKNLYCPARQPKDKTPKKKSGILEEQEEDSYNLTNNYDVQQVILTGRYTTQQQFFEE